MNLSYDDLLHTLIATTVEAEAYELDPDNAPEARYMDWSTCEPGNSDRISFIVGDEDGEATIYLSRAEMAELHRRLTVWLLRHPPAAG